MKQDQRKIAFHEAEHAVIAYRLGFYVGATTIVPDADGRILGSSVSEDAWRDGTRDDDAIVVLFAGWAAQRLVVPSSRVEDGAHGDYEKAAELHGLDVAPPHLEERAAALVAEHRTAIEAVAAALLRDGTLPEDEATLIVDAIDEGEDWSEILRRYRDMRVAL